MTTPLAPRPSQPIQTRLREKIRTGLNDAELLRTARNLSLSLHLRCGPQGCRISVTEGRLALDTMTVTDQPEITITAAQAEWERLIQSPPPPLYNSFTALQIANPAFQVDGDPLLIAQARALLECMFERIIEVPLRPAKPVIRDPALITGHYSDLRLGSTYCRVYHEVAGSGAVPVLFLHTAGADGRQYFDQLSDTELGAAWRLHAPDMPFHGRSMPVEGWDWGEYCLTAGIYRDWVCAFLEQVVGGPAILVGGSMGAAIALVMAAERPDLTLGVVALEPPFRSRGRQNPFQMHPAVHGGLHNAAFVRGLMAPTSPLDHRRRAGWIYSQGAPGIYPGDLAFYSEEFDGAETGPAIDSNRCPVALLSGEYDYSATPADGARLASHIPGALHLVMAGLGHFPATEDPDTFRPHLLRGLQHVCEHMILR
ncbi:alpha/beta fold hydrolase [Szabonella alba]|uniref:Alpha/beta hydrolase n=1 Tax=Szabonella alba TaxID=2804194 RepID=A0A8K0Y292_9RHOB|nr:alpha/beta hydrolase [Szabonella alba]MBL4919203.1 alpha/beta hydrolase [Szabonella alba]